jgi:hypothetical protein
VPRGSLAVERARERTDLSLASDKSELDVICRRLDDLAARLERLEQLAKTSYVVSGFPFDDVTFVATLAHSTCGATFTVNELRGHAEIDGSLRQALAPFTPKMLGKLLRRLANGEPRGGYRLQRVMRERGGWVWQVTIA